MKKISESDLAKINKAISEVEKQTSAEIVPMIVRQSIPTFHVLPFLILLLLELFILAGDFISFDDLYPIRPIHYWVTAMVISLGVSWSLSRLDIVKRWLTPNSVEAQYTEQRALLEFFLLKMHETKDRTGILLMISLCERRAVVLADESISSKLPQSTWTEVIETLKKSTHHSNPTDGLVSAILLCGKKLSPIFPKNENDKNELADKLIIKP